MESFAYFMSKADRRAGGLLDKGMLAKAEPPRNPMVAAQKISGFRKFRLSITTHLHRADISHFDIKQTKIDKNLKKLEFKKGKL